MEGSPLDHSRDPEWIVCTPLLIALPERMISIRLRPDGRFEMLIWGSVKGAPGDQCKAIVMDGVANLIKPLEGGGYWMMLDPDPDPHFSPPYPCPEKPGSK
jgi:hypothetical protein